MSIEIKKEIQLEIAHVLFIDLVGYSKLSINDQRAAIDEPTQAVRASEQFQNADAAAHLIKIPTGDGMASVFYGSPEAPAKCGLESRLTLIVAVAGTAADFIDACRSAASHPNAGAVGRGLKLASKNSWDSIMRKLERHIADALSRNSDLAVSAA